MKLTPLNGCPWYIATITLKHPKSGLDVWVVARIPSTAVVKVLDNPTPFRRGLAHCLSLLHEPTHAGSGRRKYTLEIPVEPMGLEPISLEVGGNSVEPNPHEEQVLLGETFEDFVQRLLRDGKAEEYRCNYAVEHGYIGECGRLKVRVRVPGTCSGEELNQFLAPLKEKLYGRGEYSAPSTHFKFATGIPDAPLSLWIEYEHFDISAEAARDGYASFFKLVLG